MNGIGEWHKQIGNGDVFGRVSKFLSMMKILVSEIQVFAGQLPVLTG